MFLKNESFSIHVPDIGKGLNFHQFGKVVCADEEPPSVPYNSGKMFHYIQAPLNERPRARQWIQYSP